MTDQTTTAFALPDHLAAKNDPALIAGDERHLATVAAAQAAQITEITARLDAARRAPGGSGQAALDRDLEVHRLTAQLRLLHRFGLDLCLGRVVRAGDPEPIYIGRTGLTGPDGDRLLIDWRAPAAEPFFAATHADPMGLVSRRRYRWTGGRVSDYWDEVFTTEGLAGHAALDDQSAFIATLGSSRSPRMRDVLSTIASDQDAIIRASSRGALVVDGGPGTGKTVVALHRTAYLLYADPRLGHQRGGVLFVGPHEPYLDYVSDVLPSLGEEGVQTVTVADLVPDGASAPAESDPEVARLKSSADLVRAIEPAVRFYEEPPSTGMRLEVDGVPMQIRARDWAEAFSSAEPGASHNDAREQVWEGLVSILLDAVEVEEEDEDFPEADLRRALAEHEELTSAFNSAWPLLDPEDLVADLWSVPAFLRLAAPWLSPDEVRALQRDEPTAWTESDLPLLDAARQRVGDPGAARRRRQQASAAARERARMDEVIDRMLEADNIGGLAQQLRHQDLRDKLVDEDALPTADPDRLAGPFAHIVVDEAQELTDAQWQMLLSRCPSGSFTIVGDRAQARHGFTEPWQERLARVGLDRVEVSSLTLNYRTPQEVMAQAEPVIRAAIPDANVPTSVREGGIPVHQGSVDELGEILQTWLAEHEEGTACVISAAPIAVPERVRSLTPVLAKGLEFDLVVLVDPGEFGTGIEGAVDRYVAMTRATQRLVILTRP